MIEIDPLIDYSKEQRRAIAFIDMKSFYASVECVERGLNPLSTSLCVMSGADNSAGLILASSPTFKKVFGKDNVGRSRDLPFIPTIENSTTKIIIVQLHVIGLIKYATLKK
jgi:DNA polymerase V